MPQHLFSYNCVCLTRGCNFNLRTVSLGICYWVYNLYNVGNLYFFNLDEYKYIPNYISGLFNLKPLWIKSIYYLLKPSYRKTTFKLTRHAVSEKRTWRIFSPLYLNTLNNCYISFHLCSHSNLAPSLIFIHKDADVLPQYLFYKWIMLVRFQRLRVALVAAQMFCVAYINTEEFPL